MNFSEDIKNLGLLSELAYLKLENDFFKDQKFSKDNINSFFDQKDEDGNPINTGIDDSNKRNRGQVMNFHFQYFNFKRNSNAKTSKN